MRHCSNFSLHNPQKAHLHPLRDVCMQYESNPANGFRYIARERNTAALPHARQGDDNIKRQYNLSWPSPV